MVLRKSNLSEMTSIFCHDICKVLSFLHKKKQIKISLLIIFTHQFSKSYDLINESVVNLLPEYFIAQLQTPISTHSCHRIEDYTRDLLYGHCYFATLQGLLFQSNCQPQNVTCFPTKAIKQSECF